MSNYLRLLPPVLLTLAALLSSCGSSADRPAPAGTVNPSDPEASRLMAEAQSTEAGGKPGKAIKIYATLVKKYPYSNVAPEAQFRHATLLDQQGDVLKAFDSYQVFIERYQHSSLYSQALNRQAVVAHAAADGAIKSNFLGIKSRLSGDQITEMLTKVRDNAPRAASAPKAQFTAGQVWENRKKASSAIAAYQVIVDDYADTSYGPEAQYRIGVIYLNQTTHGDQNQATLDQARHAFEDLIQAYPDSKLTKASREHLAEIRTRDISRSYEIAEFYYRGKNYPSASFYYQEVLRKVKSGPLHDKAARRLAELQGT